jgi:hypothetical protein
VSKQTPGSDFSREVAYAQGFFDGVKAAAWECGDCGNVYQSTIDYCPNNAIDQAMADLRQAEYRAHKFPPI